MSDSKLVGYSSSERTLDARELASLRPARANAPRKKAKPMLREVTSGIVCFCGERFAESQALEFMLHLRAEVGEDLAILERRRAQTRERYRQQRADPEIRAQLNQKARERVHKLAHPCGCGCGQMAYTGIFVQGHNARMAPAACGTESGYARHKKGGEEPCQECRDASNAAQRRRLRAKREREGKEVRKAGGRDLSAEEIVRLYQEELLSLPAIAAMMHVHTKRISQVLREAGIPIRPTGIHPRRPPVQVQAPVGASDS